MRMNRADSLSLHRRYLWNRSSGGDYPQEKEIISIRCTSVGVLTVASK